MATHLNILIVEDNMELRETTAQILTDHGHHASGVMCAEDVQLSDTAIDLFVVDLNLPGEDGLVLARRIRQSRPEVGIIMMTARRLPQEIRIGYNQGADIYLTKPVSFEELTGAVNSLARRLKHKTKFQGFRLQRHRLLIEGPDARSVALNPREVEALHAFIMSTDRRLEYWQLIELLQTERAGDPKAALEIQVLRLRKKLQQAGAPSPILQAIRGWGYQLCVDIIFE